MTIKEKEAEVTRAEARWKREKGIIEREQRIKQERKALTQKNFSTSKLLIIFLFLSCSIIEIFTCWVTIQSLRISAITGIVPDFTPLVTIIGAVVTEVVGLSAYFLKSKAENTQGGIVFEQAMRRLEE